MRPIHSISLALAVTVGLATGTSAKGADAKGYPTVDRVEFVLECMQKNGGKQEFLYKCACVLDRIAEQYSYDDFVEASTAPRYQPSGRARRSVSRSAANR